MSQNAYYSMSASGSLYTQAGQNNNNEQAQFRGKDDYSARWASSDLFAPPLDNPRYNNNLAINTSPPPAEMANSPMPYSSTSMGASHFLGWYNALSPVDKDIVKNEIIGYEKGMPPDILYPSTEFASSNPTDVQNEQIGLWPKYFNGNPSAASSSTSSAFSPLSPGSSGWKNLELETTYPTEALRSSSFTLEGSEHTFQSFPSMMGSMPVAKGNFSDASEIHSTSMDSTSSSSWSFTQDSDTIVNIPRELQRRNLAKQAFNSASDSNALLTIPSQMHIHQPHFEQASSLESMEHEHTSDSDNVPKHMHYLSPTSTQPLRPAFRRSFSHVVAGLNRQNNRDENGINEKKEQARGHKIQAPDKLSVPLSTIGISSQHVSPRTEHENIPTAAHLSPHHPVFSNLQRRSSFNVANLPSSTSYKLSREYQPHSRANFQPAFLYRRQSNERGKIPDHIDFDMLEDFPMWLKTLRLHKYAPVFKDMTWSEIVELTDEELEKLGINALGARRKLLKAFEKIKQELDPNQINRNHRQEPIADNTSIDEASNKDLEDHNEEAESQVNRPVEHALKETAEASPKDSATAISAFEE